MAYVVSAIGLFVIWPFSAVMTGFAHDQEQVPVILGIVRSGLWFTLLAIPFVWIGSLILSLFIVRRKIDPGQSGDGDAQIIHMVVAHKARRERKDRLLNACAISPYIAAALHLSLWGIMLVIAE